MLMKSKHKPVVHDHCCNCPRLTLTAEEEEHKQGGNPAEKPHPSLLFPHQLLFINCYALPVWPSNAEVTLDQWCTASPQTKKLQDFCWWCRWTINRLLFLPLPFWPHFHFSPVLPLPLWWFSGGDGDDGDWWAPGWCEHDIPESCGHKGVNWDSNKSPALIPQCTMALLTSSYIRAQIAGGRTEKRESVCLREREREIVFLQTQSPNLPGSGRCKYFK